MILLRRVGLVAVTAGNYGGDRAPQTYSGIRDRDRWQGDKAFREGRGEYPWDAWEQERDKA